MLLFLKVCRGWVKIYCIPRPLVPRIVKILTFVNIRQLLRIIRSWSSRSGPRGYVLPSTKLGCGGVALDLAQSVGDGYSRWLLGSWIFRTSFRGR